MARDRVVCEVAMLKINRMVLRVEQVRAARIATRCHNSIVWFGGNRSPRTATARSRAVHPFILGGSRSRSSGRASRGPVGSRLQD